MKLSQENLLIEERNGASSNTRSRRWDHTISTSIQKTANTRVVLALYSENSGHGPILGLQLHKYLHVADMLWSLRQLNPRRRLRKALSGFGVLANRPLPKNEKEVKSTVGRQVQTTNTHGTHQIE